MPRIATPHPFPLVRAAALAATVVVLLVAFAPQGAQAAPETGTGSSEALDPSDTAAPTLDPQPWIITVGDSYISGEGGRWAGNTNGATSRNDALGPTAYFDNPADDGELIPYCHRSKSAEAHIGGSTNTLNLACSGAETETYWTGTLGDVFKPGIDFYDDGDGHRGQAALLQDAATGVPVGMVVLSIGGNDFDVSGALETCAEDYAESVPFDDSYCHTDTSVIAQFSDSAAAAVQAKIEGAIANIRTAMAAAGHPEGTYTLVVQDYPLPIPYGSQFRYPESGYERIDTGGCGLWDADANFFVNEVFGVVSRTVRNAAAAAGGGIELLELGQMLQGRQLCETGVGLLEEEGLATWQSPGASDLTEWVNPIFVDTVAGPHFQQESMHPDYWAQLALRSCLRKVWNEGSPAGGTCTHGTGLDEAGEPNVSLAADELPIAPVGGDDTFVVGTDGPTEVAAPGVLANDTQAPWTGRSDAPDALTATLLSPPTEGTVVLRSDGGFTYTPRAGSTGTVTFTYRVANAHVRSQPVTATLVLAAAVTPSFTG